MVSMPPLPVAKSNGPDVVASLDGHGQMQHSQQAGLSSALVSLRGWTSAIAESTMVIVSEAQKTLEAEQARIRDTAPSLFNRGGASGGQYHRHRDLELPLDVEALRDAEVVYVTDRILTMGHPHLQSSVDGDLTPHRKLAAVGHMLRKRHGGHYMVWNLSEVDYDAYMLDDMVLSYKFPGSPSPPLGLLLKLLLAMESWLKADDRNVAVVHCLTGRGRTSTVLAAFLCWTGEAGFHDVNDALSYIAKCKRLSVNSLAIPSQVRYAGYFANMLDGVRPSGTPLTLKRIIMSEAPKFGRRLVPSTSSLSRADDDEESQPSCQVWGCAPYLQLFKAGNLIFTAAASVNYSQSIDDLPFCSTSDGSISFLADVIIQGDVLLRCRHLTRSGQRVSMFRAAFHTGYVPPRVLRLTKAQLDGACEDRRFGDGFFVDLIFEACDETMVVASNSTGVGVGTTRCGDDCSVSMSTVEGDGGGGGPEATQTSTTTTKGMDDGGNVGISSDGGEGGGTANEAALRRSMGAVGDGAVASASAYDTMLHRDSRFWDVIAQRRVENMKRREGTEGAEMGAGGSRIDVEGVGVEHDLVGPTIGRRRDFAARGSGVTSDLGGGGRSGGDVPLDAKSKSQREKMSAFSIGEEFGLDGLAPASGSSTSAKTGAPPTGGGGAVSLVIPSSPQPRGKDTLMEALMDLEDDGLEDEGEVVFEGNDDNGNTSSPAKDEALDSRWPGLTDAPAPAVASPLVAIVDLPVTRDEVDGNATETAVKSDESPTATTDDDIHFDGMNASDAVGLESHIGLEGDATDLDYVEDANEDFGDADDFDDLDDDAELEDLEVCFP